MSSRAFRRRPKLELKGRSARRGLGALWRRLRTGAFYQTRQGQMCRSQKAQAAVARSSSGSLRPCSSQECRVQDTLVCRTPEWLTAARFRWRTVLWGRCPGLDSCRGRCLFRQVPGLCRWGGRRRGRSRILALGRGDFSHSRRNEVRATDERGTCACARLYLSSCTCGLISSRSGCADVAVWA